MSVKAARLLFWGYVIAGTFALTFPGVLPFNRTRPFILGMPFILVWVVLWIVLAFIIFALVDRVIDRRAREEEL